MKSLYYSIFCLLILSSCASIYTSPEFSKIRREHQTVAILPFDVAIKTKKLPKGMTYEMLKEQEKDEAYTVQSTCYAIFLKRAQDYSIKFQDVDKTNALLAKHGIDYEKLRETSKDEIAHILGVDAVISGKVSRSQPMSVAGAIAIGVLTGISTPTNEVLVDFTIHNGIDSNLLWKYNHKVSGGLGSSSQRLAESLMKSVSRKFPYRGYAGLYIENSNEQNM